MGFKGAKIGFLSPKVPFYRRPADFLVFLRSRNRPLRQMAGLELRFGDNSEKNRQKLPKNGPKSDRKFSRKKSIDLSPISGV